MDISVSYSMDSAQVSAVVAGLRRFERMRTAPALVIGCAGTVFCFTSGGTLATTTALICLSAVLVLAVLAVNWFRVVACVGRTAAAWTRPSSVTLSDAGLSAGQAPAPATAITWAEVSHCTNTADTWIFAVKGGRDAVLIPQRALDPDQREQVSRLLATWPKRRYRSTKW